MQIFRTSGYPGALLSIAAAPILPVPGFSLLRSSLPPPRSEPPINLDSRNRQLSNMPMKIFLFILAYLLGSIPSGIVVARLSGGVDPRSEGSGNIGATNVLRTLGPKAAAWTLGGDVLKGVVPVVAARILLPQGSAWIYLVAGAAILGHDFSFLLRFRGGKGVATTIGTLLALDPILTAMCVITWIAVVGITRFSSAGALVSASLSPFYAFLIHRTVPMILFCLAGGALLFALHRENIMRLAKGTEKRISFGKQSSEP